MIEDSLFGNLTGKNQISPVIDENGKVIENGCECYRKKFTYSTDGLNLLLKESDDIQTTAYDYYPGTNKLRAKFQGNDKKWYRRWFYNYNEDAALTCEIVDDGSTSEINDLTDVTERLITSYTRTDVPYWPSRNS